jgi:hypothetical protein
LLLVLTSAWGQDGPRGHWTGSIEIPDHALEVQVDLDKPGKDWIGTISIPSTNQIGVPLDKIAFSNGKWTFRIQGDPTEPTFIGTMSEDGKTMSGDFTAAGNGFGFHLTRTGDAKIATP